MSLELRHSAQALADELQARPRRVVFAESCTGGLVSATLARIPGISEFHCGSAVVYRLDTKTKWLGIPADLLADPGPVSEIVARHMAEGALQRTPEAEWSASITGHLGPNAPADLDGLVYIGIARRDAKQPSRSHVTVHQHRLGDPFPSGTTSADRQRERRQIHAATLVLRTLYAALSSERGASAP